MRNDPATFAAQNEATTKDPRYVVKLEFDVASIYVTSHASIPSVPGVVIANCLQGVSAVSQRIVPDEGRSEIGSMSFRLIDKAGTSTSSPQQSFTEEVRSKLLTDSKSLRKKLAKLYVGYGDMDFTDYQLFQTQVIESVSYADGVYEVSCADITRNQRKDIFDLKTTTLRDSVTATDTTIPVYDTSAFQTVYHGASYSDAPSTTVGYIRIGNEVIRYTGKTADTFTGCTRGVLNTRAEAHNVDANATADRRPKVEEYVYLELPAVKACVAILTGRLLGTSPEYTLPSHWHLGIDSSLVALTDFTGIGPDLWDGNDTGFVVRFQGLKKTDGKRFLEKELYMLLGCYSPIYASGQIGLRRMNHVIQDAAPVVTVDERNVINYSDLVHDFQSLHNVISIDWNYNGDEFTRRTVFTDTDSAAIYGEAEPLELEFKGLAGAIHTDAIIRTRLDSLRDRYAAPPVQQTVTLLHSLNRLEVGDVVLNQLPNVRDFTKSGSSINRAMEVQRMTLDFDSGQVTVDLFGSTGRASVDPPDAATNSLPDAFYTATGTELSTVVTIAAGVTGAGTFNLTGNASLGSAVYYYDGDLTIASGTTLTINDNVQLRVKGFLTVNGTIDGVGRGQAGQVYSSGETQGLSGYVGNSRGMDGVYGRLEGGRVQKFDTQPALLTQGKFASFPYLELGVDGNSLLGLPTDLRGTSGGSGGRLYTYAGHVANGGSGADSGAGLAIVCRGMGFGASGSIDLSGNSPSATTTGTVLGESAYPGAGGAGGPGAMLILLDGSGLSVPDISGKFVAATGTVPVNGTPLPQTTDNTKTKIQAAGGFPVAGYLDPAFVPALDMSNAAHRIQYVPESQTAEDDQTAKPQPPQNPRVVSTTGGLLVLWDPPAAETYDIVQLWGSVDNDRSNALLVGETRGTAIFDALPPQQTRYYWLRAVNEAGRFSDWTPSSSTAGIVGTSVYPGLETYSVLEDPTFSLGTTTVGGPYWYVPNSTLGTRFAIESSGGIVGGKLVITATDTSPAEFGGSLDGVAIPDYPGSTGQRFSVLVRWRKTQDVTMVATSPSLTTVCVEFDLRTYETGPNSSPRGPLTGGASSLTSPAGGDYLTVDTINAAPTGVWQELTWEATVQNNPKTSSQAPYLGMRITATSGLFWLSGQVEIDSITIQPLETLRADLADITSDRKGRALVAIKKTAAEESSGVTIAQPEFEPGDVRRYGAVADGDGAGGGTNNATALQAALDSGEKFVRVPAGTYRVDSPVSVPDGVCVCGEGSATILDGTNISAPGGSAQGVIQVIGGGLTSLGSPSVSPARFAIALTFASPPSVSPRDVLVIYNSTNSSFSGHRTYYREGEFVQVRDLSGSVVNLTSKMYSAYTAANVTVYRMSGASAVIRDMKIIAPPSNDTVGALVRYGVNVTVDGLDIIGSDYAQVVLDRCFNVKVNRVYSTHLQTTAGGTDYGVVVGNSQHVRVSDGYYVARRHGATTGGIDDTGAVPCRDVRFINSYISTTSADISAANLHGNAEFCSIESCHVNGGADLAGDNNKIVDSVIYGNGTSGCCLYFTEMLGWAHTVSNVEFFPTGGSDASRGAAIDLGGNGSPASSSTTRGGALTFRSLRVRASVSSPTSNNLIVIRNRGSTASYDVVFDGVDVDTASSGQGTVYLDTVSGSNPRHVSVRDFSANIGAITLANTGGVTARGVRIATASTSRDALFIDCDVNSSLLRVSDCDIGTAAQDGITVTASGTTGCVARVDNCTVTASASTFYGIEVASVATAYLSGNYAAGSGTNLRVASVTTMVAMGNQPAISKVTVTTDIEIGSDGADVVMPGLPTSDPGGSGKVWSNSGVLNIT